MCTHDLRAEKNVHFFTCPRKSLSFFTKEWFEEGLRGEWLTLLLAK